jgi:hypothetical protein
MTLVACRKALKEKRLDTNLGPKYTFLAGHVAI